MSIGMAFLWVVVLFFSSEARGLVEILTQILTGVLSSIDTKHSRISMDQQRSDTNHTVQYTPSNNYDGDQRSDAVAPSYQSRCFGYPVMVEYPFHSVYLPYPYQFQNGHYYGYYSASGAIPNLKTDKAQLLCPVCCRSFSRESTLKVHMRIHSGEKPFKCSDCGKRFSQSGNLTVHRRIHNGIRPYTCSICDRTFIQSSSLTSHIKSHRRLQSKNDIEPIVTVETENIDLDVETITSTK